MLNSCWSVLCGVGPKARRDKTLENGRSPLFSHEHAIAVCGALRASLRVRDLREGACNRGAHTAWGRTLSNEDRTRVWG